MTLFIVDNITVTGGGGDDTIHLNPGQSTPLTPAAGPDYAEGALHQGLDGDDTYSVWFGFLTGLADAVVIDDNGNGVDNAILEGTPADETFEIDNDGPALAMSGGFD